jgi:3-(3-hydroxy-phenyl)propionate hydroxylase
VAAERDRRFLQGETAVFEFPAPGLGPGLHHGALGGTLFPQPRLADGRLLDEAIGDGFAVIGEPAVLEAAGPDAHARWRAAGAVVLREPGEAAASWLRAHDAAAVVLRPDRYLLGGARTGGELARLSTLLPSAA